MNRLHGWRKSPEKKEMLVSILEVVQIVEENNLEMSRNFYLYNLILTILGNNCWGPNGSLPESRKIENTNSGRKVNSRAGSLSQFFNIV